MKKLISVLLITLLLTSCGHPRYLDGKLYPTYGLFNKATEESSKVCYEVSIGNVVWSILGIETVVLPIYFIGFSLYNPIKLKSDGACNIDD